MYQLDYTTYRKVGSKYLRKSGVKRFATVVDAQEFCKSPERMLANLDATSGGFCLSNKDGEVFHFGWNLESCINRAPVTYRVFCNTIFGVES